jgi:hypothetical protein
MSSESIPSHGRGANEQSEHLPGFGKIRTFVRSTKRHAARHFCNFGKAVAGIWPIKPALNLAQRCNISARGAELIMEGKRKVPAKVLHVVDGVELE